MRCWARAWIVTVLGTAVMPGLATNKTEEAEKLCSESVFSPELELHVERWKNETRALFVCPEDRRLVGQNVTACFVDGNLRKPRPVCVPKTCEFSLNMCGWQSEGTWLRENGTIHPKLAEQRPTTLPGSDCDSAVLVSPLFPKDQDKRSLCFRFSYHVISVDKVTGVAALSAHVAEHFNRSTDLVVQHYKYCSSTVSPDHMWTNKTFAVGHFSHETLGFQVVLESLGDIAFDEFDLDFCPDNRPAAYDDASSDTCKPVCELNKNDENLQVSTVTRTESGGTSTTSIPPGDAEDTQTKINNGTYIDEAALSESQNVPDYVWIATGVSVLLVFIAVAIICARARRRRRTRQKEVSEYMRSLEKSNPPTVSSLSTKGNGQRRVSFDDVAMEIPCSIACETKPRPGDECATHTWNRVDHM